MWLAEDAQFMKPPNLSRETRRGPISFELTGLEPRGRSSGIEMTHMRTMHHYVDIPFFGEGGRVAKFVPGH